tara:strand:+ start:102 stop:269 length:168 start_codon:yes stop_codon:yes gene_type:complete
MTDNERLFIIKINQKEINKYEMLKQYYNGNDKQEKIKTKKIILDWLKELIEESYG